MAQKTEHLTKIEHARPVAWHNDEDIQAIRIGESCEELYVDGKFVPVDCPVQEVINYCHARTKRERTRFRAYWATACAARD